MSEREQFNQMFGSGHERELDPQRTALIVVDLQRYFTQPHHPFTDLPEKREPGSAEGYLKRVREQVIPSTQRLLATFRERGAHVIFTAVGTESGDGRDLPPWLHAMDEIGEAVLGTRIWPRVDDPAWEIDEALGRQQGELVLNKRSAGTFATTDLDDRLHRMGVTDVVVTGVATDVCVSTTAREAADRGYRLVVASDACTTLSEELHRANLESLGVFGWVCPSDEVIRALRR